MVRRSAEGSGHSSMEAVEEREAPPASASAPMPVVNRANGSSALRSLVATMLWVGPIYLTVFLCSVALFLCPSAVSIWIIGLLVVLTFGPVTVKKSMNPDVFKSPNSDTYVVFGKAKI